MFSKNTISRKIKTLHICLKTSALALLLLPLSLFAQKPTDNTRIQRDVDVLRTVLVEYFKEANPDKKSYVLSKPKVNVLYYNGFGLLISAPVYVPAAGHWGSATSSFSYSITSDDCNCDEDEKNGDSKTSPRPSASKWPENDQLIPVMKGFLTNYGNLMSFIQPGERMIFYYDKKNEWTGEFWSKKSGASAPASEKTVKPERILLELPQEDTRLSGQDLVAKAKLSVIPLEKSAKPEFEIMGKIFTTQFSNSVGSAFVSSHSNIAFFDGMEKTVSNSPYEVFKGLGVVYNFSVSYNKALRVSYSFAPGRTITRSMSGTEVITEVVTSDDIEIEEDEDTKTSVKTKDKDKEKTKSSNKKTEKNAPTPKANAEQSTEKAQASDQKANEDYNAFLKDIKNYMIEYGRTLHSLEPNERLIINVSINSWNNGAIPGKVELSVLKSVLEEYDKRNLSLEDAAAKITLKEYKKETKNGATNVLFQDK